MKKLLITLFLTAFVVSGYTQTALNEIQSDIRRSASNYMVYPGPKQEHLTPAPEGMKPFYISHYGRHGSRYHTKPSMYNDPYTTLARADSLGKLTPKGRDVLARLNRIRQDAENRWGDLTPLGAEQLRQIARRMYERFPECFEDNAAVDARSTTVGRCVLAMEYTLMELLTHNPRLDIRHNATHRDMDFLNQQDRKLMAIRHNKTATALYERYAQGRNNFDRLLLSLFSDTAYVARHVDGGELSFQLLLVAAIMQNTELRHEVSLYDIFTVDEIYRLWQMSNARSYIGWGASSANGGVQPYSQRNLLRTIINEADSCIRQPGSHVQLRFGHETVLLPLACLLDLNGYGMTVDDLDQLERRGWLNYRIAPMAANLQFIFYRRHPQDRDVLFKVLLNEDEATLPLPTDRPPYYKWSDFRQYYLQKLDDYER